MVQSTVVGYVNASAYVCEVTGATAGSTQGWEAVPRERGSLISGQIL